MDFIFNGDLLEVMTANDRWVAIVTFATGNGLSAEVLRHGAAGPAQKLASIGHGQWRLNDEEDVTLRLLKRG
jgi:hypothetical protein